MRRLPRRSSVCWCGSYSPLGRSVRDDDFCAAVFDGETEDVAGELRQLLSVCGLERAADREFCDFRIGDDEFLAIVPVEFGCGVGKRCVVEDDHAVTP